MNIDTIDILISYYKKGAAFMVGLLVFCLAAKADKLKEKEQELPALSNIGPDVAYTEDTSPVGVTQSILINSAGAGIRSASIKITQGYRPTEDMLTFGNFDNVYGFFDSQKGELVLLSYPAGSLTSVVNFQSALRSVSYRNINTDNPATEARIISFTLTDADGVASNALSKNINIIAVNDAPVVQNLERAVAALPAERRMLITESVDIADADHAALSGATVRFTGGTYDFFTDNLSLPNNVGNITATWNAVAGELSLSGVDTKENYAQALRNVVFSKSSFFFTSPNVKQISIKVSDGISESEEATRYIAIANPAVFPSWLADVSKQVNEDEDAGFVAGDFSSGYQPDPAKFTGIDIRQLPQSGTLFFDGRPLTAADVAGNGFRVAAGDIARFVYRPHENFSGMDFLKWNSFDGTSFATSNAFVYITVVEVNDAPVIIAPAQVDNLTEDSPAVLPEIVVNDIDDTQVQVEISVSHGVLSVNPYLLNLLTFTTGDGTGDPTLGFSGHTGYVSYALSALSYQPNENFSGTDPLTVTVTDRAGSGNTATATVSLIVLPANDAPVLSGIPETPLTYTENSGAVAIAPEVVVTDEENNRISAAVVTIQEGFSPGQDTLSFTPQNGISGAWEGNRLVLNGLASLADYQQALRSVAYENTSENPATAGRVISIEVKDEENATGSFSRRITVVSVDDAPVLSDIEPEDLNYVESAEPVALTSRLILTDPDDETVEKAVISFANNSYVQGQDVLSFTDTDKIKATWQPDNGTLTLNGTTSLEEYQAALRNIFYSNTSDDPNESKRTVSLQVSSRGNDSEAVLRNITIIRNERPLIASFNKATEEDRSLVFTAEDFLKGGQYSDPDNFPQEGSFARIAIRTLPTHGLLVAEDTITQARIDSAPRGYEINRDALSQLIYIPAQDYSGADTFAWNAFDGAQYAAENATVNLTVNPVNDAPVVQPFGIAVNEDDTLTFSLQQFQEKYTDAENDTLQRVIIQSLPTQGVLWLEGVRLTAGAGIDAALLDSLQYVPAENFGGSDSLSWVASDGIAVSGAAAMISILVNPVNDAPVVKNFAKTGAENEAISFLPEDFSNHYTDVENDPLAAITIETLPQKGRLLLKGKAVKAGDQINAGNIAKLVYQPETGLGNIIDVFSWNASDGTAFAPQSAVVNLILGKGVVDFDISLKEDEPYRFQSEDFIAHYGNPENSLQAVKIVTLPARGTLTLDNTPVSEAQTVAADALERLVYVPDTHYFGQDSLFWDASEGTDFTNQQAAIFFSIQPVNDAPTISALSDTTVVAGTSAGPLTFTVSDVETEASALRVTAFSDDMIGDSQLRLGGSGSERTLMVDTREGQTGQTVIHVLVSDGEQQAAQIFTLTVVPYFVTLTASKAVEVCSDQPFEITAGKISGGVAPYTYDWTCNQENCQIREEFDNTLTINPGESTEYYVQATDANGIVSNLDTIRVNIVDCSQIELAIPSGFTPNGDNINDTWEIGNMAYVDEVTVFVFNRFGQQVFQSEGYRIPWNGSSETGAVPVGTYYYVISVENGTRVFKGSVTVLR